MRFQTVLLLFVMSLIFVAKISYAGCNEFKVIDYGDRVEAVCVGEPLTEAQTRELERQQREAQKSELQTQKTESRESNNSSPRSFTGQQNPAATSGTLVRAEPVDPGNIVIGSYDIKYIPSNKPTYRGRQFPGEYSIKIVAKNNGRQGSVMFKLKQTDNQGFETESITFNDRFEKDQEKTVTTHLPAMAVPFVQSNDWIIETYKY